MCRIFEFSKYCVIFIYFQAAVSAMLAVSVLYIEKNQNKYQVIISKIRKFITYQIAFLMTCQRDKLCIQSGAPYGVTPARPRSYLDFEKQNAAAAAAACCHYRGLIWLGRAPGSKLAWSTQQASSMHLRHGTTLLSTPLLFWTCIITLGK